MSYNKSIGAIPADNETPRHLIEVNLHYISQVFSIYIMMQRLAEVKLRLVSYRSGRCIYRKDISLNSILPGLVIRWSFTMLYLQCCTYRIRYYFYLSLKSSMLKHFRTMSMILNMVKASQRLFGIWMFNTLSSSFYASSESLESRRNRRIFL